MALSSYLGNKILDACLRNVSLSVATVYVSLHTGDPGSTGANEVTGGSYARQSTTFNAASSKSSTNSAAASFTGMPAVTLTHIAFWDASTAGNFLQGGALAASKTTNAGDTFTLPATTGITVGVS